MLPVTAEHRAKANLPVAEVQHLRVRRERQKSDWVSFRSLAGIGGRLLAQPMLLFSAIQALAAGGLVFIRYAAFAGGWWTPMVSAIPGWCGNSA